MEGRSKKAAIALNNIVTLYTGTRRVNGRKDWSNMDFLTAAFCRGLCNLCIFDLLDQNKVRIRESGMNDRQSVLLSVKYWRRFQDYLFRVA